MVIWTFYHKNFTKANKNYFKKLSLALVIILCVNVNAQCLRTVASGDRHCLGITGNGTLWAWGDNQNGQLGNGNTSSAVLSPVQVGTYTNWKSVTAGGYYSLGIKTDGTLWAWGLNNYGQLGDGTTIYKSSPVQIGTDTNWAFIAAGYTNSFGIKTDGTLWAWGDNSYSQLGDGTSINKSFPIQIGTDTNWSSVDSGYRHSIGIKSNGTLWAWGTLLIGTINNSSPVQIGINTNWVSVSAGLDHSFGVKSNGTLWAWGYNMAGQLGDGTTNSKSSPVQIGTDTNWKSVTAGYMTSLGVKTGGTLWAWGLNDYGQLADGTTISKSYPVQIGINTNWDLPVANFSSNSSLGIKTDGTLWAWGRNNYGQLGDGTTINKSSPEWILSNLATVTATLTASNNGPVCIGNTLSLTVSASNGMTFYNWTGPNGFTSTQKNPTVSTNATEPMGGVYNVTATIIGCSSQASSTTVIFNKSTAGNNVPICLGNTLSLTASSIPGATYFWTGPNGFSSTLQNPTVSLNATSAMAGIYSVYTVSNGCTSPTPGTTTVVINPIPPSPTASSITGSVICLGYPLGLITSTVAGATYSWTGPNGFSSTEQTPTVTPSATTTIGGVYSVIVTVNGCSSVAGITTVEINKITASNNGAVCVSNPLLLFATPVTGAVYSWTGPNGFSSSQQNPIVSNSASTAIAGVYSVSSTVSRCTSTASVTIVTINPAIATPTVTSQVSYCKMLRLLN